MSNSLMPFGVLLHHLKRIIIIFYFLQKVCLIFLSGRCNIKLGRLGEFLSKELIKTNHNLELLNCGIQKINNKKKDVDLIFKDEIDKIIYYRELKGNIELDTEKLPATITKCKEIENSLHLWTFKTPTLFQVFFALIFSCFIFYIYSISIISTLKYIFIFFFWNISYHI